MSQKQTKRFRKEVRRRVDRNFGIGMEALAQIIRPRPRWIPKQLWIILYTPLFPKKYLGLVYKNMK